MVAPSTMLALLGALVAETLVAETTVSGREFRGREFLGAKDKVIGAVFKHSHQVAPKINEGKLQVGTDHWGEKFEQKEVNEISSSIGGLRKFGQNAKFDRALLELPLDAPTQGRYAYVIPGTTSQYALPACTVALMLRDLGKAPSIEILGLHGEDKDAQNILQQCGQFDHLLQVDLSKLRRPSGYYHDVAVKFAPFGDNRFTNYDRLIMMDADMHPLKNLDFLFNVPAEFEVFAPRAYWIDSEIMMGGMYGIKPNAKAHESMLQQWDTESDHGHYPDGEMDVVNNFYHEPAQRAKMGLLPANFLVLDSHFHHEEEKKLGLPDAYPSLEYAMDSIYTMHFSGYQKPWYHTEEDDVSHFDVRYQPIRKQWWTSYNKMNSKVDAASSKKEIVLHKMSDTGP